MDNKVLGQGWNKKLVGEVFFRDLGDSFNHLLVSWFLS